MTYVRENVLMSWTRRRSHIYEVNYHIELEALGQISHSIMENDEKIVHIKTLDTIADQYQLPCVGCSEKKCVWKKKKTYSSLKQKDSTRIIMHKNTFWLLFAVLCIYLTLVFCEEQQQVPQADGNDVDDLTRDLLKTDSTDLQEEARTRRRHRHHLCKFFHYNIQEGKFINVKQCRVKRILKS